MQMADELLPVVDAITAYCDEQQLPVFRGYPHDEDNKEDIEEIDWDSDNKDDWKRFLLVAKSLRVDIVYFWVSRFMEYEVEKALVKTLPQRTSKEKRQEVDSHNESVNGFRPYIGTVDILWLSFIFAGRRYGFRLWPSWKSDFETLQEFSKE